MSLNEVLNDNRYDKVKFMHFADAHIGHRQYNMKLRRDDIYMSFRTSIKECLDEDIDFAIFSGDLFHHKRVNARALRDAENGIDMLSEKGIPVIMIQGNHDSKLYKEDLTWIEYLHSKGKIVLLQGNFNDKGLVYKKHDTDNPGTNSGFIDFNDVRIFGLQYSGQRTKERLNVISDEINRVNKEYGEPKVTILIGHFGIEGHIPQINEGVSYNDLVQLEGLVDYLALGHIHKKYSHGDWIYNPGSLEAHNTREATWDLGYYISEIKPNGNLDVKHNLSKRRPFYRIEFSVDGCKNNDDVVKGLKNLIEEELKELKDLQDRKHYKSRGKKRNPIIDFRLEGLLQFSRSTLNINKLLEIIKQKTGAVKVQPNDKTESIESRRVLEDIENKASKIFDKNGQLNRKNLENTVFQMKIGEDSRYKGRENEISKLLMEIKINLLSDESIEKVIEDIRKKRREIFSSKVGTDENHKS